MNGKRNLLHGANLLYLLMAGASIAIAVRPANAPGSGLPQWLDPAVAMIAAQVGLILIPALLFVWLTRQPVRTTLKLNRLSLGNGVKCFLIGLLCWPIFSALGTLSQILLALVNPAQAGGTPNIVAGGGSPWIAFLGLVLVAPLFEEMLFRGVLLSAYEERVGVHAIWLVGILFALFHLSLDVALGALFVGLVAGWVVYRTRSIWAGVLVHVGANLLSGLLVLLMALAVPSGPESAALGAAAQAGDPLATLWLGVLVWGAIGLVMLAPGFLLLRSIGRRHVAPVWPETRLSLKALWSFAALMMGAVAYSIQLLQGAV